MRPVDAAITDRVIHGLVADDGVPVIGVEMTRDDRGAGGLRGCSSSPVEDALHEHVSKEPPFSGRRCDDLRGPPCGRETRFGPVR